MSRVRFRKIRTTKGMAGLKEKQNRTESQVTAVKFDKIYKTSVNIQ